MRVASSQAIFLRRSERKGDAVRDSNYVRIGLEYCNIFGADGSHDCQALEVQKGERDDQRTGGT